MTFEENHAHIHPDPLNELVRRQQHWASAPDSRGVALNARIIPNETVDAAIQEIIRLRRRASILDRIATWLGLAPG